MLRCAGFAVLIALPAAVHARSAHFALVVGHNIAADASTPPLHYADDDAFATHRLLLDAGVQSRLLVRPDADTARLYGDLPSDGAPTPDALHRAFDELRAGMEEALATGAEVDFVFFYSGHGDVAHGEGYVALEDGTLSRSVLYDDLLARSPATRNHVIVDACRSYYLVYGRGPGGERAPFRGSLGEPDAGKRFENTGFILSTSSDRDSHEWERFGGGVFSHEVRSAMRGAADADRDGELTYAELGAFLVSANRAIDNPRLRPDFVVRAPGAAPGDVSAILLRWPRQRQALNVDREVGRFYVEDARGIRVLDAHPAAGHVIDVSLPSVRPLYVCVDGGELEYVVEDDAATLSVLPASAPRVTDKGALDHAFRALFASPFSGEEVRRFAADYLSAPDPLAVVREIDPIDPRPRSTRVDALLLGTAVGAAVSGLGLTVSALQQQSAAAHASHRLRTEANHRIEALNVASGIAYGIAAASASAFLVMRLWPYDGPHPTVAAGDGGVGVSLVWDR